MKQALKPDVLMQFIRGSFTVYIQVAKMKTALTWLHISLMNSSDYCIQAIFRQLACAFVLCSDLRPVFSRTRWNTVSQVDTIVGLLATLTIFGAIKTEKGFMILWINSEFSNSLQCHSLSPSSPMWSMKQTFLDTVLIAIITLCVWDVASGSGSDSACL